jgi:hypothetical protein
MNDSPVVEPENPLANTFLQGHEDEPRSYDADTNGPTEPETVSLNEPVPLPNPIATVPSALTSNTSFPNASSTSMIGTPGEPEMCSEAERLAAPIAV